MAKHKDEYAPPGQWTLITNPADAAISAARVQNLSGGGIRVQARNGVGTDGLSINGALFLEAGDIIFSSDTFASLFPGVTSPNHLFVFAPLGAVVSISHA